MITIRAETAEDIPAVRQVNELAFGQPDEADLVDALRANAHPRAYAKPYRAMQKKRPARNGASPSDGCNVESVQLCAKASK